MNSYPKEPTIS